MYNYHLTSTILSDRRGLDWTGWTGLVGISNTQMSSLEPTVWFWVLENPSKNWTELNLTIPKCTQADKEPKKKGESARKNCFHGRTKL